MLVPLQDRGDQWVLSDDARRVRRFLGPPSRWSLTALDRKGPP